MSYITSGEVTAATLIVPLFEERFFPYTYDIVLTSVDGTMQYQLSTVIRKQVKHSIDTIDSPEWLAVPSEKWQFNRHQNVQVKNDQHAKINRCDLSACQSCIQMRESEVSQKDRISTSNKYIRKRRYFLS